MADSKDRFAAFDSWLDSRPDNAQPTKFRAFDDFLAGKPAAPDPTQSSWTDYLKAPLAGALEGAGSIAQGGGDLVARGINAVAGTELRSINPLQGAIDRLRDSMSESGKQTMRDSTPDGNLAEPETWTMGKDPSIKGLALNGLNAIGQFAPNLAIGLTTAGASLPAQFGVGAVAGYLQAHGSASEEERDRFNRMSHDELMQNSSMYQRLIEEAKVPPAQAKAMTADAAALGGGVGSGIPSALEQGFEDVVIGALTKGKLKIKPIVGKGRAGQALTGAAGGSAVGGLEEATEKATQNIGSNIAVGGNRPVGEGTFGDFVMGAIAEGVPGAAFGAAQKPVPDKRILEAGNIDDAVAAAQRALDEENARGSRLALPHYTGPTMVVMPDGTTMTGAEWEQERLRRMVQPGETSPTPVAYDPAVQGQQRTDLERDLQTPPAPAEAPQIVVPGQPEGAATAPAIEQPTLTAPDSTEALVEAQRKQAAGELLTSYERALLDNPPQAPAPQIAMPGTPAQPATSPIILPGQSAPTPATQPLAVVEQAPRRRDPKTMTGPELEMASKLTRSPERKAELDAEIQRRTEAPNETQGSAQAEPVGGAAVATQAEGTQVPDRPANPQGAAQEVAQGEIVQPKTISSAATEISATPVQSKAASTESGQAQKVAEPEYRDLTWRARDPLVLSGKATVGQPRVWKSERAANMFLKASPKVRGYTPRQTADGWVLSKPPITPAQKAAGERLQRDKATIKPTDSLDTLLRKVGGIRASEITADGGDIADMRTALRGAYRNGNAGLTLEQVAEIMAEQGYDVLDRESGDGTTIDASKARNLIQRVLDGEEVYSPQGQEERAAADAEARQKAQERAIPGGQERRGDADLRERMADRDTANMTREELMAEVERVRRERDTDTLTGLGTKFTWKRLRQLNPMPHVVAFDVDSLKWVNDEMGHEAGDKYLAMLGEAFRGAGLDAHRTGGDEVMAQGMSQAEMQPLIDKVLALLEGAQVVAIKGDERITKNGVGLSYGHGTDEASADAALARDKLQREEDGKRAARGEEPPGVVRGPAVETGQGGVQPASEEVAKTPPEGGVSASGGSRDIPFSRAGKALEDRGLKLFEYDRNNKDARKAAVKLAATDRDVMFRRSESRPGTFSERQFRSIVDAAMAKWANKPEVMIVDDMQDERVPAAAREEDAAQRSQGAEGAPSAFFYQGKVYILRSENPTVRDAVTNLFHEALGHYGLRGVFGDSLDGVLRSVISARRKDVEAKAAEYGLDMADPDQALTAAEEVLAALAQTRPEIGFVRRAVAAIRGYLRRVMPSLKLSDDEIITNFIMPARAFVEQGNGDASGGIRFHRAEAQSEAAAIEPRRVVKSLEDARKAAQAFVGKALLNPDVQWGATVSQRTLGKMVSESAMRKSASPEDHALAVANVDQLYPAARLLETRPDRKGEATIRGIHTFAAKMAGVNGKPLEVRMLVKETSREDMPNPIYTIEAVEVNRPALEAPAEAGIAREAEASPTSPQAGRTDSVAPNKDTRFSRRRTPAWASGNAALESAASKPARGASWDVPEPSKIDDLIYSLQNKQIDTKKILSAIRAAGNEIADRWNPYLQEELYHGRTAKLTEDFINKELKPLLTDMAARGVQIADFEEFLQARHAQERNAQIAKVNPDMPDGGSGMTNKDAAKYLSGLDAKKRKTYEALASKLDAITKSTRQMLVSYGLEDADTVAAWEGAYKHYVPLMREEADQTGLGTGQGFSVKGSASKRATGSNRKVVDIIANVAMQRERAIVRGEKNRVSLALHGLAKENPNPEFWTTDTPPTIRTISKSTGLVEDVVDPLYKSRDNVVVSRVIDQDTGKVKELSVRFNEQDERAMRMARALKNLDADQLGHVLGASAKVTRYFASINTQYNPVFGVINLTRDVQGAMLNLSTTPIQGKQKDVLKNALSALRGIFIDLRDTRTGKDPTSAWAKLWEEFQNEGGQTGYRNMFADSRARAEALEAEIRQIGEGRAKQAGRAIFDWLSDYNQAGENAVRLAVYKVGKDSGMSNQQAASMAKNITVNFNRKGQIALQAGALYAFFNASAQGAARTFETLTGPTGKKIVIGGLILGAAQAVALMAGGFDDDDEPPQFIREKSLILPIGGKKYISIPMPQGFNVIPNISRIATEYALSGFKSPGKRVASLAGVFADSLNPIGSAGLSLQTIAPTAIDPFAALAENKDWTGKPIAKPNMNSLDPKPGPARVKDSASWWGRQISTALNYLSGGTKYVPGALSPTPDQIDFLIGQVTGGVGREISKVAQTGESFYTGDDLPTYKIPLLGRLYGDAEGPAAQSSKFYSNIEAMNAFEAEIKGRMKDRLSVAEVFRNNPEARLFQLANNVERKVTQLRAVKRDAVEKGRDPAYVKLIEKQITDLMTMFNARVAEAKKETTTP